MLKFLLNIKESFTLFRLANKILKDLLLLNIDSILLFMMDETNRIIIVCFYLVLWILKSYGALCLRRKNRKADSGLKL